MVIYELPTAWTRVGETGGRERAVGTFKDVLGLVDENAEGANFAGLAVLQKGHSYLTELGVNALELLPAADSFFKRSWGYDTAHYLAPDWELGFPDGQTASTANADLAALVESCHRHGIRFFIDVVMAFAKNEANQWIDFDDFCLLDAHLTPADPDAHTSGRGDGHQEIRDGFGSTLFRYARPLPQAAYDPIGGGATQEAPARALLYCYVTRWMRDFRVDGIRMDSVENVSSWDFIQAYKDRARALFQERWQAAGLGAAADAHFLVVGEELTLPFGLLTQNRLDGLWNEEFLRRLRPAILGASKDGETFEQSIRRLIDCRNLGFSDGAQAILYVTSHDVEGFQKERLFTMLSRSGLQGPDIEKRIKLAFACLLTAVGIPMILAGERSTRPVRRERQRNRQRRQGSGPGGFLSSGTAVPAGDIPIRLAAGPPPYERGGAERERHRFHSRGLQRQQARAGMEARRRRAGSSGGGGELFGLRDAERAHRLCGRVRSAELAGNASWASLAGGAAAAGCAA